MLLPSEGRQTCGWPVVSILRAVLAPAGICSSGSGVTPCCSCPVGSTGLPDPASAHFSQRSTSESCPPEVISCVSGCAHSPRSPAIALRPCALCSPVEHAQGRVAAVHDAGPGMAQQSSLVAAVRGWGVEERWTNKTENSLSSVSLTSIPQGEASRHKAILPSFT